MRQGEGGDQRDAVVPALWYGQLLDSGADSRHAGCLLSWRKGVAVQETSQEHRGGARQGTRWCSTSTQQILDVSVPFTSEQRFQLIT